MNKEKGATHSHYWNKTKIVYVISVGMPDGKFAGMQENCDNLYVRALKVLSTFFCIFMWDL